MIAILSIIFMFLNLIMACVNVKHKQYYWLPMNIGCAIICGICAYILSTI